ncbi:MAG TPA: hypothetical protein VGX00_05155 [Thermoplasmata archaeon]|nr:hypothetical protein [Thermoplasmata archaeon]
MSSFDKVLACLKALGLRNPSPDNFEEKLVIQKAVYLLQLRGVQTGFEFNLYVRGPYSPALTAEIYGHRRELRLLETPIRLTMNEARAVGQLREWTHLQPSLLEVAATYAYFSIQLGRDPLESTRGVRSLKGFYPESQIALGISLAKKFLIPPTAAELAEMREEHAALEDASLRDLARSNR